MTELIDVDDLYEPYRLARAKVREALALLEGPEKDPDVLHAELRDVLAHRVHDKCLEVRQPMVKIYIAGPITASSPWKMTLHIRRAEKVLIQLLRGGFAPFCPHTMTAYLDGAAPREAFLETDLVWL